MSTPENFSLEKQPKGYQLSGKIMLSAIIILFSVVIFILVLHLYARWYLHRARRRVLHRRRSRVNRRAHIVFYVDNLLVGQPGVVNHGLEPAVLNSLPVFVYSSKDRSEVMECAVCLSEFEDDDTGRVLPKCNHSFHIECIDMWFHSHSTCPLCRSAVEPVPEPEKNREESVASMSQSWETGDEPGSSSTTSLGSRRKGLDFSSVRIEVPRRTELENGLESSSPAGYGLRSPGTRLLSIKRILSMNRKSPAATASATSAGGGTSLSESCGAELDLESGLAQERTPSRTQTPR